MTTSGDFAEEVNAKQIADREILDQDRTEAEEIDRLASIGGGPAVGNFTLGPRREADGVSVQPMVTQDLDGREERYVRTGMTDKLTAAQARTYALLLLDAADVLDTAVPMDALSEAWKPIPGYEGLYEVSDEGRVRSLRSGKLMKGTSQYGYRKVVLCANARQDQWQVHRLVMLAFVGPGPEGSIVRHLNDVKDDNRLANLSYGTSSDNAYDRVRNGNHFAANKTHCKRGHEFTPENTLAHPNHRNGNRTCKTCQRAFQRAHTKTKQEKSRSHIQRPNTTEERWLPVVGFEGRYSVSDQGRVRSESRKVRFVTTQGTEKFRLTKERILKQGFSSGYPKVALGDGNISPRVHDLVAQAFIGPKPEGQYVRHLNDDPCDNWLDNLAYGTAIDNAQDRIRNENAEA